jgi:hypothetical protein
VILFEFMPFTPPGSGKFGEDAINDGDLSEAKIVKYQVQPTMVGLSKKAKRPSTTRSSDADEVRVESEADLTVADDEDDEDE